MDEYLTEKEQIERIREWWRDNGWYVITGIVLGALMIFGVREYRAHRIAQTEQAAVLYGQVRDAIDGDHVDAAAGLVKQMREKFSSSPYTDQAGLMLARAYLNTEPSQAAVALRYVMDHSRDHELGLIARLRLARVLIFQKKYQDALDLLAVDNPGEFEAQISEIRGDAYVALGDQAAARTAYANALTAPGADWINRNFLQMKLGALKQAGEAEKGSGA